jgi:5-methylcytosine-specific restriction enzyme subunit McrC
MNGTLQSRQTILLTERIAVDCQLPGDDVDYLLAQHRPHLDLRPTRTAGRFCITPRDHVGTILTPHCRLHIRPKMPLESFFYLLDSDAPLVLQDDQVEAVPGAVFLDLLALRLAGLMRERAAQGLHRDYRERQEQQTYLQGRLDVPAQMRLPLGRKDLLACRYEEFTADLPINQVPRATAEHLLTCPFLSERSRQALHHALGPFREVTAVALSDSSFCAVLSPLTAAYRPLLDLCRVLFEGLSASSQSGATSYPTFLLSLEQVFERYCTRHLVEAFAADVDRLDVRPQLTCTAHGSRPGQPALLMRPDVTFFRNANPILVVDTKWKSSPFVRSDLYQVLGYCAALGCPRGMLVYPGVRNRSWEFAFDKKNAHVTIHQLRTSGSAASCRKSMARFVRLVKRLCRSEVHEQ